MNNIISKIYSFAIVYHGDFFMVDVTPADP